MRLDWIWGLHMPEESEAEDRSDKQVFSSSFSDSIQLLKSHFTKFRPIYASRGQLEVNCETSSECHRKAGSNPFPAAEKDVSLLHEVVVAPRGLRALME